MNPATAILIDKILNAEISSEIEENTLSISFTISIELPKPLIDFIKQISS